MSSIIIATTTFDGTVSSSPFYTMPVVKTTGSGAAFIVKLTVTASLVGVTVQYNADPDLAATTLGWQDDTRIDVYDMTTKANLAKTNAGLMSGATRGGVIAATVTDRILFVNFTPLAMAYKVLFDITGTATGTVTTVLSV